MHITGTCSPVVPSLVPASVPVGVPSVPVGVPSVPVGVPSVAASLVPVDVAASVSPVTSDPPDAGPHIVDPSAPQTKSLA
jgi:hypothetical protein